MSGSVLSIDGPFDMPQAGFQGFVEFYGYHVIAGGWFFSGWTKNSSDLGDRLTDVSAWFANDQLLGPVSSLLFIRDDLRDGGIGFLIFLQTDAVPVLDFSHIQIGAGARQQTIYPITGAVSLSETKLARQLSFVITKADDHIQRLEMELLIAGDPEARDAGYIEYFGYHQAAGGWFVNGWVRRAEADIQTSQQMSLAFENGDVRGEVVAATYPRADLPEGVHGVILFLRSPASALGKLCAACLYVGRARILLPPITSAPQYREAELTSWLKSSLAAAKPALGSERLLNLLSRRPYAGQDTLETLSPAINFHIDEAIRCGASGLALIGWMLAKPGEISQISVRCGSLTAVVTPADFLKMERPDVLAAMARHGFDDSACGFVAYVNGEFDSDAPIYIEIETRRYQIAFRNVPIPIRSGMAAIRHLLSIVDARFIEIQPAFDRVIGPAVEALNKARLAVSHGDQVMVYGGIAQAPAFSVIVPLHGRLDFVEYQQALFSAWPPSKSVEFIYVLDDPPKRREAQRLFASVYERFQIPFRAILLNENVGFAPANNAGLRQARGKFIVYLNSDVFPGTPDWLERLSAHLIADPLLGAIGPQLLFEDGSVQHTGMYFERLAEYGGWFFCQHHGKAMRYSGTSDLQYYPAITGACMVLRRDLANQLGGFDETYAIGDFEDSDLCLKLHELGLKCAVDPTVQLYHLERKSQLSGALGWRANLTAYNAWQHERRWGKTIESLQSSNGGRVP